MKSIIFKKLCLIVLAALPLSIAAQSSTKLYIDDYNIKAGETKTMNIGLSNPDMEVTALQFDLYLPDGLSIAIEDDEYVVDIDRTTYKKHSLDTKANDGFVRFLLASSKKSVLSGTTGTIITVSLVASSTFESGTISLKNITIADPSANKVTPADVEIKVGENTAVEGITVDKIISSDVYDLSGRRVRANASSLEGLSKGVYLMNGKKVVKN